ncbi:hypothetical protein D3C85_1216250 [compost metagenome]
MVAKARQRVTYSMVKRIANHTAPAGVGDIQPHFQATFLDVVIQIEIADAGLHDCVAIAFVDLNDAVHPLQIQHNTAAMIGR